jgi:iron complex outermembrane receptor protein
MDLNYQMKHHCIITAAYVYKKVNSFANYRTPYWRTLNPATHALLISLEMVQRLARRLCSYGDLNDYNATLGYKAVKNGWNTDAGVTVGGNSQTYSVTNSQNRSDIQDMVTTFIKKKPYYFSTWRTAFNHIVGNLDISKNSIRQSEYWFCY